jgi:hypothetical protein
MAVPKSTEMVPPELLVTSTKPLPPSIALKVPWISPN